MLSIDQVLAVPASEILASFFSAPQSELDSILESVTESIEEIRMEERRAQQIPEEKMTARDLAHSYHRRLLMGASMAELSKLPEDLILFSISLPVHQIAELACGVACESGRLMEISDYMIRCAEDEGLTADEIWTQGKGPDSYQVAANESDDLLSRIFETVSVYILQRYRHLDIAKLYENNRAMYDIRCEIGRRLIDPEAYDEEDYQAAAESIRQKYGPEFYQEFERRLSLHGL